MNQLIPMNDDGLFADKKSEQALCDSRFVAMAFEKEHKNVLRDINVLLETPDGLSPEFGRLNFELSSYRNAQNKKQPCYHLTRDGFTMLVMGYTGASALRFKEHYIKCFNEMEKTIKALKLARADFPMLTEQIRLTHENPKPYHYSNECDMINRIALGMTAKEYKSTNNIPETERSIRPYLTGDELTLIDYLQTLDAGMVLCGSTYEQRKNALTVAALRKVGKEMMNP